MGRSYYTRKWRSDPDPPPPRPRPEPPSGPLIGPPTRPSYAYRLAVLVWLAEQRLALAEAVFHPRQATLSRVRQLDGKRRKSAMMKTRKSLIVAAAAGILAALAGGAEAYTCPTSTSCTPTVSYSEPSTYVSGAALGSTAGDGLKETEIQWALGTATPTKLLVPATAVAGGGAITNTGIAASVTVCTVAVLNVSVIARTILGAVSAPATATPLTIDRTKLPTGAPDPSCTTPGPAKSVIVQ